MKENFKRVLTCRWKWCPARMAEALHHGLPHKADEHLVGLFLLYTTKYTNQLDSALRILFDLSTGLRPLTATCPLTSSMFPLIRTNP